MSRNRIVQVSTAGLLALAGSAAAQVPTSTVAVTGVQAWGMAPGVAYGAFTGFPSITHSGRVLFTGAMTGPAITADNDTAGWVGYPSSLAVLYREGAQAPGLPAGIVFSSISYPMQTELGQIAMGVTVRGPGVVNTNDNSIYSGVAGSLIPVAREGNPAALMPAGVVYGPGSYAIINTSGRLVFNMFLSGTGINSTNNHALYSGTAANLQLLSRAGDQAPGQPAGVVYGDQAVPYSMNLAGHTAFIGWLAGPTVTQSNDIFLAVGQPGNVSIVLREGSQAPGFPLGYTVAYAIPYPSINDAGRIAAGSHVAGSGVTTANDSVVWVGFPSSLQVAAREGQPAPGLAAGVQFGELCPYVTLGAGDHLALCGALQGAGVNPANDSAIWRGTPGSLSLVAREGDQAPGLPAGVTFGDMSWMGGTVNARGQIMFQPALAGAGVDPTNDEALYATAPGGTLRLIARKGAPLVVNGSPRTVASIDLRTLAGGQDSGGTSFNDSGLLIFRAGFTDGTSAILLADTGYCYANCDGSTGNPSLNVNDFICFQSRFAAADPYADCDASGSLNVNDFVCFQSRFAAGCP